MYITAIIPAHNEENNVGKTIESIKKYVNKIIVACDNCSDKTFNVAFKSGSHVVFNTVNNTSRKAGAINQALNKYVDFSKKDSYCLIMDADTSLVNPSLWFQTAKSLIFPNRPHIQSSLIKTKKSGFSYDCVGSIFIADENKTIKTNLEMNQLLEWKAYKRKIHNSQKVLVLTGTCSLISTNLLLKVRSLPGRNNYYNESAITEDFEFTIAAKKAGARMISPMECLCITETKKTFTSLIAQRRRWYLGALSVLANNKIDNITISYLGQQLMLSLSVLSYLLYLFLSLILYAGNMTFFSPFWFLIFLIFQIKNIFDIWPYSNLFEKIYVASMVPGLVYSFVLQISYLLAIWSLITKKNIYWNSSNDRN